MRQREDQRVAPRNQFMAATSTSKSPLMSCLSRGTHRTAVAKEGERTLSTLPRQAGPEATVASSDLKSLVMSCRSRGASTGAMLCIRTRTLLFHAATSSRFSMRLAYQSMASASDSGSRRTAETQISPATFCVATVTCASVSFRL